MVLKNLVIKYILIYLNFNRSNRGCGKFENNKKNNL